MDTNENSQPGKLPVCNEQFLLLLREALSALYIALQKVNTLKEFIHNANASSSQSKSTVFREREAENENLKRTLQIFSTDYFSSSTVTHLFNSEFTRSLINENLEKTSSLRPLPCDSSLLAVKNDLPDVGTKGDTKNTVVNGILLKRENIHYGNESNIKPIFSQSSQTTAESDIELVQNGKNRNKEFVSTGETNTDLQKFTFPSNFEGKEMQIADQQETDTMNSDLLLRSSPQNRSPTSFSRVESENVIESPSNRLSCSQFSNRPTLKMCFEIKSRIKVFQLRRALMKEGFYNIYVFIRANTFTFTDGYVYFFGEEMEKIASRRWNIFIRNKKLEILSFVEISDREAIPAFNAQNLPLVSEEKSVTCAPEFHINSGSTDTSLQSSYTSKLMNCVVETCHTNVIARPKIDNDISPSGHLGEKLSPSNQKAKIDKFHDVISENKTDLGTYFSKANTNAIQAESIDETTIETSQNEVVDMSQHCDSSIMREVPFEPNITSEEKTGKDIIEEIDESLLINVSCGYPFSRKPFTPKEKFNNYDIPKSPAHISNEIVMENEDRQCGTSEPTTLSSENQKGCFFEKTPLKWKSEKTNVNTNYQSDCESYLTTFVNTVSTPSASQNSIRYEIFRKPESELTPSYKEQKSSIGLNGYCSEPEQVQHFYHNNGNINTPKLLLSETNNSNSSLNSINSNFNYSMNNSHPSSRDFAHGSRNSNINSTFNNSIKNSQPSSRDFAYNSRNSYRGHYRPFNANVSQRYSPYKNRNENVHRQPRKPQSSNYGNRFNQRSYRLPHKARNSY